MNEFSHIDKQGNVKMVDVTDKVSTVRTAKAEGKIFLQPETISAIQGDTLPKGNVLTIAKVAGVQAAKKTAELIPMCHQLNLSFVDIDFISISSPAKEYIYVFIRVIHRFIRQTPLRDSLYYTGGGGGGDTIIVPP